MQDEHLELIISTQEQVLSSIALDKPVKQALELICSSIDSILLPNGGRSSLLIHLDGYLYRGAGPNMPPEIVDAYDALPIGESAGSCGTAAYMRIPIVVEDISTDPRWAQYKELPVIHGLKSCWSTPILSAADTVLGTFAIYNDFIGAPEPYHFTLIQRFSFIARMALEHEARRLREKQLRDELTGVNDKLTALTSVLPDMGIIFDSRGNYIDVFGDVFKEMYSNPKDLIGTHITSGYSQKQCDRALKVIATVLETKEQQTIEYLDCDSTGKLRHFEGRVSAMSHYQPVGCPDPCVLWMVRDITERKDYERRNNELAYFDPLTSLPNRRFLLETLESLVIRATRNHQVGSVLFLDLNDFKRINDSLGHSVGDELLIDVARRIKSELREIDFISRIGGDEFVIVIENVEKDADSFIDTTKAIAEKLIRLFNEPFKLRRSEYYLGVSIGIYMVDNQDVSAFRALTYADTAMYRAKTNKRSSYAFFDPELQAILESNIQLEHDLYAAVKNQEFLVHYQPQVDRDNRVIGLEALVRWRHPTRGLVSPAEFLPAAEKYGVMVDVQALVFKDVCIYIQSLMAENVISEAFRVSVNVSAMEFQRDGFITDLKKLMAEHEVRATSLTIELTEGAVVKNIQLAVDKMTSLKADGFHISIDDFGTGYSSLTYLHTFPFDELKIDKSFIDRLGETPKAIAIVDAFISLACNLNLRCIAEGVEDRAQYDLLMERDVFAVQGYYFAPPMPAGPELMSWLAGKAST